MGKERLPDREMGVSELFWVVPDAATRIWDKKYQATLYEAFHQHQLGQWGHFICMWPINWCLFYLFGCIQVGGDGAALLSFAPDATAMNMGFLYLLGLSIWYLGVDLLAGAITMIPLLIMWTTANLVLAADGGSNAGWVAFTMYIFSALQSASHAMEDIPPPYNGTGRFVPRDEVAPGVQLRMLLLFPFLAFHEFIASPKLLVYQTIRGLQKFGYAPELKSEVEHDAQLVLATGIYDPANEWQMQPVNEWELVQQGGAAAAEEEAPKPATRSRAKKSS